MKMADFKALPKEEQITRLNNHLLSIRGLTGKLENNFKRGEFEFSYSHLKKYSKNLGLVIDGSKYLAYAAGEEPSVQREGTKAIVSEEKLELTIDEINFVKSLFKGKQNLVNPKQMLFVPTFTGDKKTTGISVYIELWERWGDFKKQYAMYSGTDLLALALEEFMEKYTYD